MNKQLTKKIEKFWDDRPCNIRHSKKPVGEKEYFNEVEAKKYFVEPHIPIFAEFEKWTGLDVLEIGCGIGTDSINFVRNGANLDIVELSGESLNICKKRFSVFDLNANFYKNNAEVLTTFLPKDKKYDLVYSFGVIHHASDPERIINEIKKVLKPGGELRIMLYSKYSFKLFDFMYRTQEWDFGKADEINQYFAEAQTGCPAAKTYTFDNVRTLLNGFEILEIRKDHIFPYKIPEYISGKYVIEDHLKNMPKEKFIEMEKELGWHTLVKAKLK